MRHAGAALCALVILSACGDPLRDVERLSDVEVTGETAAIAASDAEPPGLFRRLFGGGEGKRAAAEPEADAPEAAVANEGGAEEAAAEEAAVETASAAEPAPRRGFLGGLFGGGRRDAGLTGTGGPTAEQVAPDGPDAQISDPDRVLAFGEMARVCDLTRSDRGQQVAKSGGFVLYDTVPGTTGQRTHYITGFGDGCARQFSAALVLFGSPLAHEAARYDPLNKDIPYSETDAAYEDIKRQVCGVGRGTPCGARMDRLARGTVFLTAYERFESSPVWADILIHDGAVVAMDLKDR